MFLRVHGLLEVRVRSSELFLFTLDFVEFVLQSRDVLLWEFIRLLVNQTEILSVQLDYCSKKLDRFRVWVVHHFELCERGIGKALVLSELFHV